jgi:hypothetical protein
VDLAARASTTNLPLVLALLAIPGVIVTWGLIPGGGFVTGVPLAIAAIVTGIRRHGDVGPERSTLVAIGIGAAALLFVAVCTATGGG